jgi:hypothetical protein
MIVNALQDEAVLLWIGGSTTLTNWTHQFKATIERVGLLLGQEVRGLKKSEKALDVSWYDQSGKITLALECEWDGKDKAILFDFQKVCTSVTKSNNEALGVMIFDAGENFVRYRSVVDKLYQAYEKASCKGDILILGVEGAWRYGIRESRFPRQGREVLNANYDFISIIDLFMPDERTACRLSESVADQLRNSNYHVELCLCRTAKDVLKELERLVGEARNGAEFMIQFSMHGSKEGIGNHDGTEFLPWADLRPLLTEINTAMKNRLVINFTACFGIHAISTVAKELSAPFFGIIGPEQSISANLAGRFNAKLYSKWMHGKEVKDCVVEASDELASELKVSCVTTQDIIHFEGEMSKAKGKHT